MKRCILLPLFVLYAGLVFAQDFAYPVLPPSGASVDAFAPAGWSLVDSTAGDLTGDGAKDAAFVIEYEDAVDESKALGDDYLEDSVPRILAAVVWNDESGAYELAFQSNTFILRSNEGGIFGDPFDSILIDERGVLNVSFYGGSAWRWALNYKFRFQEGDWYLIGATNLSYHNGSGEMEEWSYNFLSMKRQYTTGDFFDRTKDQAKWSTLTVEKKTIRTFKRPWSWEIAEGEHI